MKPVVSNPSTSFTQLFDGLEVLEDEGQVRSQIEQIVAKLQRRKRIMSNETLEQFQSLADGMTPDELIDTIEQQTPEEARETLRKYEEAFEYIQDNPDQVNRYVVISEEKDALLAHERGFGEGSRPEDYLDAFAEYIRTNINEIAALNIVCTRPKELTREALKGLRLALDREGFTTQQLNTAVSQMTDQEIAADIISLIRRYAIGSALISHEARVRRAVERLKKAHRFTKQELNWIERMEKYLMEESVLNVSVFDDDGRFKTAGGFNKINRVFQNQLESIVAELNEYLFDDGGRTA